MDELDIRLLGPFEVRRGPQRVLSGGGKRNAVMARLLLSANRSVSVDRLVDDLWGALPPRSAVNLVQGYVSDLRRALEPDRAARVGGSRLITSHGYQLRVEADELDLDRFRAEVNDANVAFAIGDTLTAAWGFDRALACWRGDPLADFAAEPFAVAAVTALRAAHLDAVEAAADVQLALGHPRRALATVEGAASTNPLRERMTEIIMRACYECGRTAEALAAYERIRVGLADELGTDPSPRLQALHLAVLRAEPLSSPTPLTRAANPPRLPIPSPPFDLIGRARDLAAVTDLLHAHRLVTITGPGGSGKTRLAVEIANRVSCSEDREAGFVDLASVREPTHVAAAIAQACRLHVRADVSPLQSVAMQLARRHLLLVLDNLEHLLDAVPDIAAVLAAAPKVTVLATSREPLGLAGEQQYPLRPLMLPTASGSTALPTVLAAPAVELFVARARAADPTFHVSDRDAGALAQVCRRLDGLPLALELAAPWTKTLSLRALLERLDRSLDLLVSAAPESARHSSLRTAIEWSYASLSSPQRELLHALSVFASGARLETVEAVVPPPHNVLATLAALIDKNLVFRTGDPPRYRLLATIREYAAEQLAQDPDSARRLRSQHAELCCRLAETAGRAAHTTAGREAASRIGEEHDEIRTALTFLTSTGEHHAALTLAIDCLPLWWDLGHVHEGYRHLALQLQTSGVHDAPIAVLAAATLGAAILAASAGDTREAINRLRSARELAIAAGDTNLEALGVAYEGDIRSWIEEPQPVLTLLKEALELADVTHAEPPRWGWTRPEVVITSASLTMADLHRFREPARAREALETALEIASIAEDDHSLSFLRRALGFLAVDAGDYARAEDLLDLSLRAALRLGSERSQARSHQGLAALAWARGELDTAVEQARQAVQLSRDTGHTYNWGRSAALLGDALIEQGDLRTARAVLNSAMNDIDGHDHDFALRWLAPRQARLERLDNHPDEAHAKLAASEPAQIPDLPTSERIVYVIECAFDAADHDRLTAQSLLDQLATQVAQLQQVLPTPERCRIRDLRKQIDASRVRNP